MSKDKQIKSTDWLTRGIPEEQLEREKQEAIMSADLALCHTEFMSGVGKIYTDYDTTAQKMYNAGYRKKREGEWIEASNKPSSACGKKCSLCGARIRYSEFGHGTHKYCHKCGAKMKGE